MLFSSLFGITSIFTQKFLSSSKIKWLSSTIVMSQLQRVAPQSFPVTWKWFLTFSSSYSMSFSQIQQMLLDWNYSFSSRMIKFLLKWFFYYFFTILILFKNRFKKFKSSIFTSKNKYWLSKFIINTKAVASKTTRNVILIFFNQNQHKF